MLSDVYVAAVLSIKSSNTVLLLLQASREEMESFENNDVGNYDCDNE